MKFLNFFLVALFLATPALAQEKITPVHALAKNGAPKYTADFKNFDYVNPATPKGGTLKLNALGSFDSLNPFILKGSTADGVAAFVYDTLMQQSYDEPFTVYCSVCETVELAPDKTWMIFNIRPKAKWQDGQPITAEDVAWTFHTLIDKGSPFYRAYYGDVKDVVALSPSQVKFTFKSGQNAELPLIVGQLPVLPKHYWMDGKHKFEESSLEAPMGSGPYKIGQINPGHSVEFIRDPNYWGKDLAINKGRWNFDHISYDYYRDGDVALEAFLGGRYDARLENVAKLWATAYDSPAVKDGRIIKQEIPNQQAQGIQGFLYNVRRPLFQDPKIREALAYAFDFEWSNKQFAYGAYKRSRSYFSNSPLEASGLPQGRELEILNQYKGKIPDRVYTEEYNPPKTDGSGDARDNLKTAMKILDDAGWKLGADGLREKNGVKLQFEIIDAQPEFERWVLPFIKNLARIGVKASFRVVDSSQYENRMKNFDYDMTVGSYGESASPGNEQRDYWNSAKADIPGARNYIGVKDSVVDALVEGLITAKTPEDLAAYCHALDRVLQWNFYLIPQWHIANWRIAWWAKLQHPDHLSPQTPGIADTWWSKDVKQ